MYRRLSSILAAVLFAAVGCGGIKTAPVSGTVTFNGKPYKNAIVTFQPMGTEKNDNPGRGSVGVTDANGKFTLLYDNVSPGAVVGKHRVRIVTRLGVGDEAPDDKSESRPSGKKMITTDPIPAEWHDHSDKMFDVPAGGTDQANFDIVNPKSKD